MKDSDVPKKRRSKWEGFQGASRRWDRASRPRKFYRAVVLWCIGAIGAFTVTWFFLSAPPLDSQPKAKSTHPRVSSAEEGRLKESTGPRVIRVDEDRPKDSTGPRIIRLDGDRSKSPIISSEVHVLDGDT